MIDDAADHFACRHQIDSAAAKVIASLDVADVFQINRFLVLVATDDKIFQLVDILVVDDSAQLILAIGHFDGAATRFLKHTLDCGNDLTERYTGVRQQRWKDLDLILLLETSDRSEFGHSRHRLQRRLDLAFIQKTQFAQIVRLLVVDQRVLIDPTHAAGVGAQRDAGIRRQLRPDRVDPIQHQLLHLVPSRCSFRMT